MPALGSVCVRPLDFSDQVNVSNRREVVLVYELWQGDQRLSLGLVSFAPNKHLKLTDPELGIFVREKDEGIEIEITAQRLARFVWLELDGADVVFGDNYFDLPAGRAATVALPPLEGWTAERVREALRVRSLMDSYAGG